MNALTDNNLTYPHSWHSIGTNRYITSSQQKRFPPPVLNALVVLWESLKIKVIF
jgi:hypothetical protein